MKYLSFLLVCLITSSLVMADTGDYGLQAQKVAEDTWVFIGTMEDFSLENGGNIVNTGFIVTEDGVVVIDSGPSWLYGQQVRVAIKEITELPIVKVILTHHHPDHVLGSQAYKGIDIQALPRTIKDLASFGEGYLNNVYRMSGDWMLGTELVMDWLSPLSRDTEVIGGHRLRYIHAGGHTASDLMVLDETTGVLFAGDLVFHNRTLTTPHAEPQRWFSSLDLISKLEFSVLVPGHGQVARNLGPVEQTRDYLSWLEQTIRQAVENGLGMNEVLATEIPHRFRHLKVLHREFTRSVSHRFPVYEKLIFQD